MMSEYHCPVSVEHSLVFNAILTVNRKSMVSFTCLDCWKVILLEDDDKEYLPRKVVRLEKEYPFPNMKVCATCGQVYLKKDWRRLQELEGLKVCSGRYQEKCQRSPKIFCDDCRAEVKPK